jgi:hypothetical protein
MRKRVPQPPVNPIRRDPERHDFWLGCFLTIVAGSFVIWGAVHTTAVDTTDGNSAREFQLVKSFTCGGLKAEAAVKPPDPTQYSDPATLAEALERMAREEARSPRLKYRVNVGAASPCPT